MNTNHSPGTAEAVISISATQPSLSYYLRAADVKPLEDGLDEDR